MKKLFCILLSVLMLITAVLAFNSCTPDAPEDSETTPAVTKTPTPEDSETTPAVTKTPTPEGYKVYTKGSLSFAYPSTWTDDVEDILQDPNGSGDNITIVSETKNDSHYQMTTDSFISEYKPAMEAMGFTISNVNVEQKTNNNGINVTKVSFDTAYMGINMKQTQFAVTFGDKTYTVTVTERVASATLVENVFQTIDKVG